MANETTPNDLIPPAVATPHTAPTPPAAPAVSTPPVAPSPPVAPAPPVVDLSTLTRAELGEYALSQFNLSFKAATTKAEILAAIAEANPVEPVRQYRVKRPVRDDKKYGVGAIIWLTARAAAPLLRTQAIEPATETVPL